jgi:quinol monooxygenase YgiN
MRTFERGSWVKHTRIPSPYRRHSASFPISFVPNLFRSQTLVSRIHANIRWTSATFPLLLGLIRMVSPIAAPAAEMQIGGTRPRMRSGSSSMPTSCRRTRTRGARRLERWAEASRGEPGNRRFDVLRQAGSPNHFTVIEAWGDAATFTAHALGVLWTTALSRARLAIRPLHRGYPTSRAEWEVRRPSPPRKTIELGRAFRLGGCGVAHGPRFAD